MWQILKTRPNLLLFTLMNVFLTFSYAQLFFALPLQLADTFGEKGPQMYGWVMTVNAGFVLIATPFIIAVTKQIHSIYNVAMAAALYAVGFGMIYWVAGFEWFVISTLIWTTGEILSVTNTEVYIASHSPQSHRGRINSVLPIIIGTGWALSPVIMGSYIEWFGIKAVWLLIMAISAIGATLLVLLGLMENRFLKTQDGADQIQI